MPSRAANCDITPRIADAVRRRLMPWFRHHQRDLPWRRSADPYSIWVSELMLQQTQVATVIPYFERFMLRFPTVKALADAPLDDVLRQWAGLGYYARARNMHRAARIICDRHDAQVPADVEVLRALPGIGPYTAGAIASIAHGRREPLLDGNVARVLARLLAIRQPVNTPATQQRLWSAARALLPRSACGQFNQALMELGATVCTARSPACAECPIARHCAARQTGIAPRIPVMIRKSPPRRMQFIVAAVHQGGMWLFEQRPPLGLWGGLWQLPNDELNGRTRDGDTAVHGSRLNGGNTAGRVLKQTVHRTVGLPLRVPRKPAFCLSWQLTHRTARFDVYPCEVPLQQAIVKGQGQHWLPLAQAGTLPLSAAMSEIVRQLQKRS